MTPFEFGLLIGIVWSSVLVVWALADLTSGEPSRPLTIIMMVYDGFDFSARGILRGGLWGFADGFITGFVLAWLASWIW